MRKELAESYERQAKLISHIAKLEEQLHISGMLPETFKIQDIFGTEYILPMKERERLQKASQKEES